MTVLVEPHHDGSDLYVEGEPALGGTVSVRLRVPRLLQVDSVALRSTPNAEIDLVTAKEVDRSEHDSWWQAELSLENPLTRYRFVLSVGDREMHVNGAGTFAHEVSDAADFALTVDRPPSWLDDTVGYQIFPDRFARSGASRAMPDWALPASWDDAVNSTSGEGARQIYGGDLDGIREHLDHLDSLGVTLLYLTPFFPAASNHRYDATTFDAVDPLLGGDDALVRLVGAAGERGMRVIGDLTLNHSGRTHRWFQAAQADASSPEASFYVFTDHPDHYLSFPGAPTLPKLDYRSEELRRRLISGDDSPVRQWLRPPYGLSGWRIDVAASMGRFADVDLNEEIARLTRQTAVEERSDAWVVAEHAYDSRTELGIGGWHGVMAYHWFTRPLWSWLRGARPPALMGPGVVPRCDAATAARSMRALAAGVPWSARRASMTMLDSHDTARARTALGDNHLLAVAAQMTMPGVPTIFAGSEMGVEGADMDTCRVPFPWDDMERRQPFFDDVRALVALRRSSPALQAGSMRWLAADATSMTYVREHPQQTSVIHLTTRGDSSVVPVGVLDARRAERAYGTATLTSDGATAELVAPGPGATIWNLPG
jgi:alpha-glucosidase